MANLDHAPSPSASCSQSWPWRRWRQNPHLLCVRGILSSVLSVLFAHPPCPPCQWKGKRVQSFSQENVPNSYNKVFCKSRSKFSSKVLTTPQLRNHDQTSTWKSWTKLRFQFFTNLQLRQSAKDFHTWAVSSTPFPQLYPCLLNFFQTFSFVRKWLLCSGSMKAYQLTRSLWTQAPLQQMLCMHCKYKFKGK